MFDPSVPYNDLPPLTALSFDPSPELFRLAEDTHVALSVLDYAIRLLPAPDILLDTLALQEARASSGIENISTTNDDLYRGAVFESFTPAAKEITRYKDALLSGYRGLLKKGLLSPSDIDDVNAFVNTKGIGIRSNLPDFTTLTRIVRTTTEGCTDIIYTPPHGKELLQSLLIDLLDYVYDDEQFDLHPLVKIALAHYQFESIHPYSDGNGRTGRILNVLFLCQKEYLHSPVLYASAYIIDHKNEYYSLLRRVREDGDLTSFVRYMLISFKETAEKTLTIVENIRSMIDKYTSSDFLDTLKGQREPLRDVINSVFRRVYVRISDVTALGIHRQTAASYLDQLVDEGLLTKEKIGKDNLYKNIKLLSLFDTN